jgi:hypothetical protein
LYLQVSLATAGLKNVPPAFSLPSEKEKLLAYAAQHPEQRCHPRGKRPRIRDKIGKKSSRIPEFFTRGSRIQTQQPDSWAGWWASRRLRL